MKVRDSGMPDDTDAQPCQYQPDHTEAAPCVEIFLHHMLSMIATLLSVEEEFVQNLIKTRALTIIKLDEKTIRVPAGSVERYLLKRRLDQ